MIEEKRKIISAIILCGTILLALSLYFFVYPFYPQYFPKCIFHNITGLYCPLCGTQRAFAALMYGNIPIALRDNALFILSLPFMIYFAVTLLSNAFVKKQNHQLFYSSAFIKISALFVIIFTVLRNVPFYPFNLLAPL